MASLDVVQSIDLEEPTSNPKLQFRLQPFWHWQGVRIVQHAAVSFSAS
jgi:hypothetical protein